MNLQLLDKNEFYSPISFLILMAWFGCNGYRTFTPTFNCDSNSFWYEKSRFILNSAQEDSSAISKSIDTILSRKCPLENEIYIGILKYFIKNKNYKKAHTILAVLPMDKLQFLYYSSIGNEGILNDYVVKYGLKKVSDSILHNKLMVMYYYDQLIRKNEMLDIKTKYNINTEELSMDQYRSHWLDSLKHIVKDKFPSIEEVGVDGLNALFILIQHSDSDPEFQKGQLIHIKNIVDRGELPKEKYAYLYDRVMKNSGNPQLYGTQIESIDFENKKIKPFPITDENNLKERRKEMSLLPFEYYELLFFFE